MTLITYSDSCSKHLVGRSAGFLKTLLTLGFLCVATIAYAQSVPIFVTSAGAVNGFTDPSKDNSDSVKDLVGHLKGKKGVTLVTSRDAAKVVIVVMNRELSEGGAAGLFSGSARDVKLRVKLIVDGAEAELSASAEKAQIGSGGAWGRAAGKLANQIEDWVKANHTKLVS